MAIHVGSELTPGGADCFDVPARIPDAPNRGNHPMATKEGHQDQTATGFRESRAKIDILKTKADQARIETTRTDLTNALTRAAAKVK
jgi:hypothetical protein